MKSFNLKDGDTVHFTPVGSGGAKRRATSASKDTLSVVLRPKPDASETEPIKKVLTLGESININGWIASLKPAELKELVSQMDNATKTGNLGSVINSYMDFVNEWKTLED